MSNTIEILKKYPVAKIRILSKHLGFKNVKNIDDIYSGISKKLFSKRAEMTGRERELLKASRTGDLKKVKYLVENGADVNALDEWGKTPLYMASYRGHLDIVKYLLENGADVNPLPKKNIKKPKIQ